MVEPDSYALASGVRSRVNVQHIVLAYLAIVAGFMVVTGLRMTPDVFLVIAGLAALFVGRGRAFVRDWFPLIAIFLAWQVMRGVAWQSGLPIHSDAAIAVERWLNFGYVPSEVLQAHLRGGHISMLDIAMTAVYQAHFIVPLVLGFALWMHERRIFQTYMAVLLIVSIAQFVTTLFLPVAPPRFAYRYGEALDVVDVAGAVQGEHGWGAPSWIYTHVISNPVAAFPSLHAAYPLIALLAVRQVWPRLAPLFALYAATVWFAIVYLGHHYLVDAYAGAVYAAVGWLLVTRWRMRERATTEPTLVPEVVRDAE